MSPPQEAATASSLTTAQLDKHINNPTTPATTSDPSTLAPLTAANLTTTLTTSPQSVPPPGDPEYARARTCTDHMITVQWRADSGWSTPHLRPYGPLSLMPTASVLHYATECFEGLKLYRGHDGALRLFRPDRNCARMARSAARVALPSFDPLELEKLIVALCRVDGPRWLPRSRPGAFLYLRPTLIADEDSLGVQAPRSALLFIILNCFPDLSDPNALAPVPGGKEGDDGQEDDQVRGLKLLASKEDSIRAWPGGFGAAKLGANYGPSLLAQREARDKGFNQILWLFGSDAHVTEAGASNFFVVWRTEHDPKRLELVTAGLEDKVILEGVTRASVLDLARDRLADELSVVERRYTMAEVEAAIEQGRLVEAFAAGTAFFVAPVGLIEWRGKALRIPTVEGATGRYARLLRGWLSDIKYGKVQHEWGVVVPEEGQ